ncbi:MAG: hypothetical protein O7A65_04360, partial [Proteobacteria bacterium]|nr:hypothetical protein [Pseudomonadota bacterium]
IWTCSVLSFLPLPVVRSMITETDKRTPSVIKEKFRDDEAFRGHVTRYLDHFEKLLADAKECDPENVLSSTFLSAEVGKLYVFLARAVGRLN